MRMGTGTPPHVINKVETCLIASTSPQSYFYHGPTIVTIDSEPEGATAPAFTPDHSGTDNPDARELL